MSRKNIIKVLGSLDELNSHNDGNNIVAFQIDNLNYGLLIYTVSECRISFFKLNFNELSYNVEDNPNLNLYENSNERESFNLCLLNIFCLPFNLLNVVYTRKNIWAIGQKTVGDLKLYIESALKNAESGENEECMDVDGVEEFHHEMFDITINIDKFENCDFHLDDNFVGCSFVDCGFVLCRKNSNIGRCYLEFVLLNNRTMPSSDVTTSSILDFPLLLDKIITIGSSQGQKEAYDPVIIFIHYNDPERIILENLFGINCLSLSVICLIGHPDGKLLYSFCDCSNKFYSPFELQTLFDIKQSIVGMFFIKDIGELEDCGCMLIVGALGQITLISSKNQPSFTLVPGKHPFWIITAHLKSSISDCIVLKDSLLHFSSDGTLWITDLSKLFDHNQKDEQFFLASNSSELSYVEKIIDLDKNQGLMLVKSRSGNLYFTLLEKAMESDIIGPSLPSLMNECLQQSISMQELSHKKVLQSRLFASVSIFASLKFSANILKEPISFSLSEINLQPRKYILVINLKCLEILHLDLELCHVTASVFTYVKNNYSLVSKTIAYNPDEPTLCLELTDTVLQPPFTSIFPLFVEVGLVLQLPNSWKIIDCFKTVSNFLPFYLRIQTFMVHELNLFQCNTLCPPQSFKPEKPKILQIIKELGMKRPIFNLLHAESKNNYNFPVKFNLCLTASSVDEMMKSTGDLDPCLFIEQLLFGKKQSNQSSIGCDLTSKQSPLSVAVAKNNNNLMITIHANSFDSLLALRIAAVDILLSFHNKNKSLSNSSAGINIPASIYRRCEEISKSLINLYGKDVESNDVSQAILQLYQELRADISGKLPIL